MWREKFAYGTIQARAKCAFLSAQVAVSSELSDRKLSHWHGMLVMNPPASSPSQAGQDARKHYPREESRGMSTKDVLDLQATRYCLCHAPVEGNKVPAFLSCWSGYYYPRLIQRMASPSPRPSAQNNGSNRESCFDMSFGQESSCESSLVSISAADCVCGRVDHLGTECGQERKPENDVERRHQTIPERERHFDEMVLKLKTDSNGCCL